MPKKILVIDDDTDLLSAIKSMIETDGYDVKTLSSPLKAEECIDKFKPDLMIIDVFMPEKSGFNLIEGFNEKGLYKNIPKIFLTGLDDDVERMAAKGCGVDHYITKPFQPEELLRLIDSTFKRR